MKPDRIPRLLLLVGGVAAIALLAPLAVLARQIVPHAPVRALGVSSDEVAYVTEQPKRCFRVSVWNVATRGNRFIAKNCFAEASSGGQGVTAISVTNRRVLWLQFQAGNQREWMVMTAAPGKPKRL